MHNFTKLLYTCEKSSGLMRTTIDQTLLPIAMEDRRFHSTFVERIKTEYPSFAEEMPGNWRNALGEQYAVAQLFGSKGLVKDYLEHRRVKQLSARERGFLTEQLQAPWEFVFMRSVDDLGNDFFEMKDLISEETFLLYSPGVSRYEAETSMSMYFALRNYNGLCYQTYGPILYFRGLPIFDVLFFASQLDGTIDDYDKLGERIQEDPLPFMALMLGSEYPTTVHKSDPLVLCRSQIHLPSADLAALERNFLMQEKDGVHELRLKHWNKHPHFAICYYDSAKKIFLASSLTMRGYEKLVDTLASFDIHLPETPETLVTPAGHSLVQKLLGREVATNPYATLFEEKVSPETQAHLDDANRFLALLFSAQNSGEEYDLQELAEEAGITEETAQELSALVEKSLAKHRPNR